MNPPEEAVYDPREDPTAHPIRTEDPTAIYDSGDGQKRQLTIPVKILRHLPFIPMIQWLYMIDPREYYAKNLPSMHNPPPGYNAGENEPNLSLFRGKLGSASASTTKTLTHEEWRCIMLYVLNNLDEVAPYIG
jgi:hypothetical protein